jgi:arylsulfatase A-like enzyme
VVFVFADQWRAQATGYAGDPNVKTPHLDKLANESINFTTAVAGCPVCSPYRASLLTGQYPLTHGVFVNDVYLNHNAVSIADAFNGAGHDTAYIGKWHVDGHGRSAFIPRERRQGFSFWKVLECTHNYNKSPYYADENVKLFWDGYDAIAQTREAQSYIKNRNTGKPFLLVLSWGPPHNPYETAPEEFRRLYNPEALILRPNVPAQAVSKARKDLAGYYAHCSALDFCVGELLRTLKDCRLEENTIFVFTSDHGDMLGSQGEQRKQRPWDESILVPFLLRYPGEFGKKAREVPIPFNAPDIMPTLLGLCDIQVPQTVEGLDFSKFLRGGPNPLPEGATLIACYHPFGEWPRKLNGKEYRGVRTERYTYVRDLNSPWLLYDSKNDPYQLVNLWNNPAYRAVQEKLEAMLSRILKEQRDEFVPGEEYIKKWGYVTDATGTVPFTN